MTSLKPFRLLIVNNVYRTLRRLEMEGFVSSPVQKHSPVSVVGGKASHFCLGPRLYLDELVLGLLRCCVWYLSEGFICVFVMWSALTREPC